MTSSVAMKAGLLFVFALLTACSSGGSSTDSSAFIASRCEAFAPCCAKAGRPADGARCSAFFATVASKSTFDQAKADRCLADIQAAKGSADYCEKGVSPPSCDGVFGQNGTKAPGETCSNKSECAPSTEGKTECGSVFIGGTPIRKCQIVVVGKAGDSPCVATIDGNITVSGGSSTLTDVPAKGYSCDRASALTCDSTSGACTALAKEGEHCALADSCLPSLRCDGATSSCVKRAAVGAACTTFDSCEEGASCEATVCKAKSKVGAACTSGSECTTGSCVDGLCGSDDLAVLLLCGGS